MSHYDIFMLAYYILQTYSPYHSLSPHIPPPIYMSSKITCMFHV